MRPSVFLFLCVLLNLWAPHRANASTDTTGLRRKILHLDSLSWDYGKTNADSAVKTAERAYVMAQQLNDTIVLFQLLRTCGSAYLKKGYYERGIEYFSAAQLVGEKLHDDAALAKVYTGLAVIYKRTEKYDRALYYNELALKSDLKTRDSSGISTDHNNLGVVLRYLKKYNESAEHLQQAIAIRTRLGERSKLTSSRNNLGNTYCSMGRHADAIATYRSDLADRKVTPNDDLLMANLGDCNAHLGRYTEARRILDSALVLAQENNSLYNLSVAHNLFSDMCQRAGDYKGAYEHLSRGKQLEDSLRLQASLEKVAELQERYESAKKDKALSDYKRTTLELQLSNERSGNILRMVVLSSVALLFLVLFLFQRRARIQRAKQDEAIIRERERGLKVTLEAVENERGRIARDLHDGIAQQLAALKMSWQKFAEDAQAGKVDEQQVASSVNILDAAGKEVRALAHDMMPPALRNHGLAAALSDLVQKSFSGSAITASFDDFTNRAPVEEHTAIHLYRIAQEIINNIHRHAGATQVHLQLLLREGRLLLRIEDNGKGFNFAEATNGMGLTNIKSRVSLLGGELRCESSPGKGTTFIVRVKL